MEVSYLTAISKLSLQRGSITGTIPPEYSKLSNLVALDLDKQEITGHFPTGISFSSNLESIDLNYNRLLGGIQFLSKFEKLKNVHLDNNYFQGTISPCLGGMTDLSEYFHFNAYRLQYSFFICNCNNKLIFFSLLTKIHRLQIEILALHNNNLTGTIPEELGHLTNLCKCARFFITLSSPEFLSFLLKCNTCQTKN